MTEAETRRRQAGHCTLTPSGHKSEQAGLRKPVGLSETGAKAEAAKLPECWPGVF